MSSYFRRKGLNLTDIGFKTSTRIYINESLTSYNREVFNAAAQAKRIQKLYKYFTRRGLVYVQMAVDSNTVCIESIGKLNSLISEYESPVLANGLHSNSAPSSVMTNQSSKIPLQQPTNGVNSNQQNQMETNAPSPTQLSGKESIETPVSGHTSK